MHMHGSNGSFAESSRFRRSMLASLAFGGLLAGLPGVTVAGGPKAAPSPPPPTPSEPAPRFWHALTTADNDRLAMFGGSGGYQAGWKNLNDLWFYNPAQGKWALAATGRTVPSPRRSLGWSCGDGVCVAANGVTVSYLKETWVYDLGAQTWTQVNCLRYLCPSGRMGPAMAYDPSRGYHVLFGGDRGVDNAVADTYTFASGLWNAQSPAANPSARSFAAATFVPHHQGVNGVSVTMDRVVLFGGYGYQNFATLCDMWSWTDTGWEQVSYGPGGVAAPCLYSPGVVWEPSNGGGRLIVSGGYFDPPQPPRTMQDIPNLDTWAFTFTGTNSGVWSNVTQSCSGTPTSGAMMARDKATGKRVYFGGVVNTAGKGAVAYSNLVSCQ